MENRIIGLLDNDTAAAEVMKAPSPRLGNNFRLIQLPKLSLLSRYPTLGPTGPATMDVNGLAASLELFFGEDILEKANGDLTKSNGPVTIPRLVATRVR